MLTISSLVSGRCKSIREMSAHTPMMESSPENKPEFLRRSGNPHESEDYNPFAFL